MADGTKFDLQDQAERSIGDAEQRALARYLADTTRQLEAMASASKLKLLAFLLAMARAEAESISLKDLEAPEAVTTWSNFEAVQNPAKRTEIGLNKKPLFSVEASEIILFVTKWAGGREEALLWYRSQPIAAFGDRTAESLVKSGHAEALRDYLDSIALGGYA